MNNYSEKIQEVKALFEKKDLKYIHYNSISNFIYHLDEIKKENYKIAISKYLDMYFLLFEEDVIITKDLSKELFTTCVQKIGNFYNVELGFKLYQNLKYEIFIALHIDIILLISGVLKKIYYIPVTNLYVVIRYIYLLSFKKDRMLYGYQY